MTMQTPTATTWWVEVFLGEVDGRSEAVARLHTKDRTSLSATGTALLHPGERDVPEIGYELAAARALSALALQLLEGAADDITDVTRDPTSASELRGGSEA